MNKQIEEIIDAIEFQLIVANATKTPSIALPAKYGMFLLDLLRKQGEGEWISVDERLPDADGDYLVWNNYHKAIVGHYWLKGRYFISKAVTVTHWMPLPEPPEMKGGE